MNDSKLMTLDELSKYLKKCKRTILRYEEAGLIPARLDMPGRQALWHRQTIDDFIDAIKEKTERRVELGRPSKAFNNMQRRVAEAAGVMHG